MNSGLYDFGRQGFAEGAINWLTDDIRCILVNSGYSLDLANHQYLMSVIGFAPYTAQPLTLKTTNSPVGGVLDADDVTFYNVGFGESLAYIVVYLNIGSPATSRLIACMDTAVGLPVITHGGDIIIQWDNGSERILKL